MTNAVIAVHGSKAFLPAVLGQGGAPISPRRSQGAPQGRGLQREGQADLRFWGDGDSGVCVARPRPGLVSARLSSFPPSLTARKSSTGIKGKVPCKRAILVAPENRAVVHCALASWACRDLRYSRIVAGGPECGGRMPQSDSLGSATTCRAEPNPPTLLIPWNCFTGPMLA
jgi:hypothetical protein